MEEEKKCGEGRKNYTLRRGRGGGGGGSGRSVPWNDKLGGGLPVLGIVILLAHNLTAS
jgi:hypothetical protein